MSSSMSDKKREESFFVNRFLASAGLGIEPEPWEAPDFKLIGLAHPIGLEVTRIFYPAHAQGMPRRAVESLRDRVVRKAQAAYEETGNPPVHVSVFFSPWKTFGKVDVGRLANSLLELVLRNFPEPDSHTEEEYDWLNREWFPEEFNRISVWRISALTHVHWSAPAAEYIRECSVEQIQHAISNKAARFATYSEVLPECWLLLVTDDSRLSGLFDLPAATLAHEYTSPFKRIYLLRSFRGQVYQLKTTARSPQTVF